MSFATTAIADACTAQSRIDSPLGPILLARTANGLAGAWFFESQQHHPPPLGAPVSNDDPLLGRTARAFDAYFAGRSMAFDGIPLDLRGSPFQVDVWRRLLAIAPGETTTYGAIATALGRPGNGRAVGTAVGRNPVGVIVPCHRVVGSGGALTGYAAGLERKRALLALEGRWRSSQPATAAARGTQAAFAGV